jgi:hypothetical protein
LKVIFSPDIYRNYCSNDVLTYTYILLKLSESCSFNKKFFYTIKNPVIFQEDWCYRQGLRNEEFLSYVVYNYPSLYVYFEIPENIRKLCIDYKIPYLNFMTSKMRFPGMEPCIMMESNLDLEGISVYEDLPKPPVSLVEGYVGKVVAIGQMDMDRSTIFSGIGKNIFDYYFEADIFRPHPHALIHQKDFSNLMNFFALRKGLEVKSDGNIYQIMTCVKKLIGISSSTLYEAQYIGTDIEFLQEKDYISQGKIIKWQDINPSFWNLIGDRVEEFWVY